MLKQGFGICAQPCGSFPHSLKRTKSEQMFGKQEPKVSAMKSFHPHPQSCLQCWKYFPHGDALSHAWYAVLHGSSPRPTALCPPPTEPMAGAWWVECPLLLRPGLGGEADSEVASPDHPLWVLARAEMGNLHSCFPGLVQSMNNWRALQSVEPLGQVFASTLFGGFFLVWLLNRVDKIKRGTFHASAFCSIRCFHETTKDLKEGRTSTWFIGI